MNSFDLLFEEKCAHVNISKNSRYMLVAKSKKCVLYDFQKKEKICDINVSYVVTSLFTSDEKFIVLKRWSTFCIYDIAAQSVIATLRTGNYNCAKVALRENTLFYVYIHKNWDETVYSYNIITKKKTALCKKSDVTIEMLDISQDKLLIFFNENKSSIIKVDFVDLQNQKIKEVSGSIPAAGVKSVAYSDYTNRAYIVKEKLPIEKTLDIYSVDINSGKETKFLSIPNLEFMSEIKAQGKKLYITRCVATRIIDLEDGDEAEVAYLPAAYIDLCSNRKYFTVCTGEFIALYQYN